MREFLRRTCDEGWIIELSPEGNRPQQDTRLFGADVGRQLCIAVFARYGAGNPTTAARVHRLSLTGTAEQKLARLHQVHLDDPGWAPCRREWEQPFLATDDGDWEQHPTLKDVFPESSRGVTTGRTWIYAPDTDTLYRRWRRFIRSGRAMRREMLPESRDRTIDSIVQPLPGFPLTNAPLAAETGPPLVPIRVAYRSFDRQWVIPDSRLMVMPRPPLWAARSSDQIYLTEQSNHPIDSGPGVTFTQLIPDIHHYNGRSGRVFPLYCDSSARLPNVTPGFRELLQAEFGHPVTALDLFAYVATVVAHNGYTQRFRRELEHPGVRVPLTSDPVLWAEAVKLGYEILWLHTFGESRAGRRVAWPSFAAFVEDVGPKVVTEIPDGPGDLPEFIDHDADSETLIVGVGQIRPVSQRVWNYNVGGMRVIRHWFNYRCAHQRYRRRSSPLDDEMIRGWSFDLTDELLEIIAVLNRCVNLEPRQESLLQRVCAGQLITVAMLKDANVLPASGFTKLGVPDGRQPPTLF